MNLEGGRERDRRREGGKRGREREKGRENERMSHKSVLCYLAVF